jgi:putative cardiolipin synthase
MLNKRRAARAFGWLGVGVVLAALSGCTSARTGVAPAPVPPAARTGETRLEQRIRTQGAAHEGASGFYVLDSNLDAFLARAELAAAAERTLDVQSYIIRGDVTGRLLAERLLDAADRGVRVRLLVDDVSVMWKDSSIVRLDAHPNIDVRVFNPFIGLRTSWTLILYDFLHAGQLSRRMHNKMFAVDNALAIVGGRNIGDEYFAGREDVAFMDLDVLVAGPAVRDLTASFEDYWNSEWAYPVTDFKSKSERAKERDMRKVRRDIQAHFAKDERTDFADAMRQADLLPRLLAGKLTLDWAKARVVYDRPIKVSGEFTGRDVIKVSPRVWELAEEVKDELIVISPYFVPGEQGVKLFEALRKRGVRVRLLTNSLRSTDVTLAHTGYARYRRSLLQAGVELYELRPSALSGHRDWRLLHRRALAASLHTKAFIFDRRQVFVGSMNLDNRAHYLNTELGLVIDSPEVAQKIARLFEETIQPKNSYQLGLECFPVYASPKQGGTVQREWPVWFTEQKGQPVRYTHEPHANLWLQFWSNLLMILPLEGQL